MEEGCKERIEVDFMFFVARMVFRVRSWEEEVRRPCSLFFAWFCIFLHGFVGERNPRSKKKIHEFALFGQGEKTPTSSSLLFPSQGTRCERQEEEGYTYT